MSPKITMPTGDVRSLPRVTEVIRAAMPRPAFTEWELREVVKWAQAHPDFAHSRPASEVIAAWRSDHRKHADRGTAVHRWIAAILKGEVPPALLASQSGYKTAFMNWMVDYLSDVSGGLVEQTLTDGEVAGTADFICNGHLYDWKTVEKLKGHDDIWPDERAQLGAYASMRWSVDDGIVGAEAPEIHTAHIVRLAADGQHRTMTLKWPELRDAISLWSSVQHVARATMPKTAT